MSEPTTSDGEAVYNVFDRSTPAGRALFAIYNGDNAGKKTGNKISGRNRAAHQKKLEGGYVPTVIEEADWNKRKTDKPSLQQMEVPVPQVYGAVARDPEAVGRPGLPFMGKKAERQIKAEAKQLDLEISAAPAPEYKGLQTNEKEKIRYARKLEFNGKPPEEMPEGHFKKPVKREPPTRLQELEGLFADCVTAIEEREEFLADMT
eukprot:gene19764-23639_t